jgi:predicted benzoate:H+ symporter BenE
MTASIVDWGALLDVILISALAGLAIALTLGVGIVASLRAQDQKGNAMALHAVTVVSVVLVAGAIAVGLLFLVNK